MKLLLILVVLHLYLCACASENLPSCPRNEHYNECVCWSDTCLSLVAKYPCGPCVSGCTCREGFLRIKPGRECVPKDMCPDYIN